MNTDTIGRAVALVAGVVSTLCALGILLEDVIIDGAAFELKHALVIGIVSLAIFFGHLVVDAWRARHPLGVIGFAALFLVATGLVVYKSTGRQAEHTYQSQAAADLAADERARIRPLLEQAEAMLSRTTEKIDKECVHGKKSKGHCDGLRATHAVYTAAVDGHHAALDRLGPPKPVAPEAENFAALAEVFGADKAKVKAASVLAVPFLQTLLFELGGILGLGFAFRHRRRETEPKAEHPRQPSPSETAQTSFHADDIETTRATLLGSPESAIRFPGTVGVGPEARLRQNGQPKRPGKGGNGGNPPRRPKPDNPGNRPYGGQPFSKLEAERDLVTLLATGATVDEQNDLAARWSVHKGTASKWLRDMRERGLIPPPQRVGRCHRLVAAG